MSRLALGTAQFGLAYGVANTTGQVAAAEAQAMLRLARQGGVDIIDTAIAYGASERCLGDIGTEGFKVVTKLPAIPDDCPDVDAWIRSHVDASLSRLRVTSLYGVSLHRPAQLLTSRAEAIYRALQRLKEMGTVRKVGISIYAPSELDVLVQEYPVDLVQAPFNIVDRRLHASGWLERLTQAGVEVHARSAFLQGLLLMPRESMPAKFSPWSDLWRKWHDWLKESNVSAIDACLSFVLGHRNIDRVVVGADSAAQLAEILACPTNALHSMLPDMRCNSEDLINPARWALL